MKICFLARPSYDVFTSKLFKYLKENRDKKIEGIFITSNKKESKKVQSFLTGVDNVKIEEISDYFRKNWNKFTYDNFLEYEKKYDCAPIWKYIYMDRFLINCEYEYCVKITTGYFSFWEQIFQNRDIDFYYDEVIATIQTAIACIVGEKYGVKYISQMVARGAIEATHHYFLNDIYEKNILFPENYKEIKYSDDEWKRAEKLLEDYENYDVKASGMIYVETKPTLDLSYLLTLLPRYIHRRLSGVNNDLYFYMYYKQHRNVLNKLVFYIRYHMCRKYYHKADYSKKFVYFPLHYQPEASTIVCAQKYEKQLFFIDSWAKSLPADTLLYVKEHYARLGHRETQFYKELKKYPNVVLIDPWENSKKLIIYSKAVTTLTGSAAWEAMLLRKPVIIGGRVFHENAPGTVKVEDIYQKYLGIMEEWKQPAREEILQYLCAMLRTMSKGNMYVHAQDALTDENISLLGNSLYEMLIKILNCPKKYHYFEDNAF